MLSISVGNKTTVAINQIPVEKKGVASYLLRFHIFFIAIRQIRFLGISKQ